MLPKLLFPLFSLLLVAVVRAEVYPSLPAAIPPPLLEKAVEFSATDSVGSNYCGRGVWSVLTGIGYGRGIVSMDGQDWEGNLKRAGWIPLYCPDPKVAPLGSVLVYLSDMKLWGRNLVGTKGGLWGHVELVGTQSKPDGSRRVYISDAARGKPGGTVPFNFTRRAWVPPDYVKMTASLAKPVRLKVSFYDPAVLAQQSEELMANRLALASAFFGEALVSSR